VRGFGVAPPVKFADLELDPARFELRRSGRLLKLERIPMELLILLVERNGDLVTREEIVTRLWGNDVFLDTEHGINTAIRKIRQALRDNPEQPRFIQTVTGRGYRFIAGVPRVYEVQGNGHGMLEPPQFSETGDRPIPHADAEKIPGEVNAPTPVPASRSRTFLPIVVGVLVVTALAAA
jgi:DNA-binding winged helix-turn-helix (wHTH) protein